MKKFYKILLLSFSLAFVFGVQKSEATHMMGADITYKCLDTLKYQFTVKLYRDCRGVSLSNPSSLTRIKCKSGGSSIGVSMTLIGIRDVTPVCASATNPCNPKNTYGTGKGIEEHEYRVTIDFNSSTYSALKNCCKLIFETGQCCRNGAITTGASNANFYTYAELDICAAPCNSSPALTTEPIAFLCCNQAFYYNNGASDTSDFDSLSYSFAFPLSSYGSAIAYTPPFTYKTPFTYYDPFKTGQTYPNANPPIGVYLDPATGDLILTPTKCDESTVAVMEIKEWRKDSTGKMIVVGVTRRDMQFWVENCPGNNPPIINGPYSYSVCAGERLCFNVTTDDKVFVPPPPLPTPDPDTVTATWNYGIPGATFSIIDPTARLQTGRFCWTPPIDAASDLPYTFTVTARDDACPRNAITVRAFSVRVKFRAEAERVIDTLICGEYEIQSVVGPNFKGTPTYLWQLLDENGSTLFDNTIGYFKGTHNYRSTKQMDTLHFRRGGTYIIRHEINNGPNCPSVYFDTLVVPPLLEIDLALQPDTFVCANTEINLEPPVRNGIAPFSYNWSTGDTTEDLDISLPTYVQDSLIRVEVTDGNGCVAWDTITVFLKNNPTVDVGPDQRICTYDFVILQGDEALAFWDDPRDTLGPVYQGDTLYKRWFHNGNPVSTDSTYSTSLKGQYVLRVTDSLGCFAEDTMMLSVNDTVKAFAGPDQVKCWNDLLTLTGGGLDTAGNWKTGTYVWYDVTSNPRVNKGTASPIQFKIFSTTNFQLELYITEYGVTCLDDDTMNVRVNPLPVLTLPNDQSICCDAGTIALSGQPSGGRWYDRKNPGYVDYFREFVTKRACDEDNITTHNVTYVYTDPLTTCTNEDSFTFTVNPLPKMRLEDGYFCQDREVVNLANDIVLIPANLGPIQSWNCVDCGTYDWSSILFNQGNKFFPDYILRIGEQYMPLGNKESDSITIELTYGNPQGCFSKDTATVVITKVPKISIPALPELCWNDGAVNLTQVTGVTPNDGRWMTYDTIIPGVTRVRNDSLNGALKDNVLDTRKTVQAGGRYYLRYYHDATGCPVWRDTIITIWPLPVPQITETPFHINTTTEPFTFCVVDPPVNMTANPSGGTFSSNFGGAVSGASFRPTNSPTGSPFWIKYSYTDPATGCVGADSVRVQVYDPPTVNITQNDTAFCRYENMRMDLELEVENSDVNSAGMIYQPEAPNTVTFGYTRTITIPSYNDNVRTFNVVAFANDPTGVCPEATDLLTITTHPIPSVTITPDDPAGCEPHFVTFTTEFFNDIDNTTAGYNWDFSDGGTSTTQNPTYGFTRPGTNMVSMTVTSAFGCDTTVMMPIDVYPNPVANFVPDPNNSTTAALPKFSFTDKSTVADVLNAEIVKYAWDFGDPNNLNDTSSERHPVWVYGNDTATYLVQLVVETVHGCKDSISKKVLIGPDILVFIPNAFTPNKSGPLGNEGFKAVTNDGVDTYHMIIFNRWGEVLWETEDKTAEWDGTYQGAPVQQDVYSYLLEVTSWSKKKYKYSGTVTLIR